MAVDEIEKTRRNDARYGPCSVKLLQPKAENYIAPYLRSGNFFFEVKPSISRKKTCFCLNWLAYHQKPFFRLMVVLISDGNSQDLWKDVVAAADRLHATKADVYAVTVSHDYFFR